MGLDPKIFDAAKHTTHNVIRSTRGSESDHVEAKANLIADQAIADRSALQEVESEAEEYKDSTESVYPPTDYEYDPYDPDSEGGYDKDFEIPPESESGLIDPEITLDESQVAAIDMLVREQYGCLIGAAGSGKTTSQRFFLHKIIYGDEELNVEPMRVKRLNGRQGLNIALVAFTGMATQVIKQNMPEWLWPCCKTIHSLLEFAPVSTEVVQKDGTMKESMVFMPHRNKVSPLDHDIILIDEASMVGLDLWHQLLDACRPGTKIFLVGDLNQLPPVTSVSMFAYALSAWPVAELTKIHRQKEAAANKIIDVAHHILRGESFDMDDPQTNKNWRVIGFELDSNPAKAGAQIVAIANQLRARRVHSSIDPDKPLIYDPYRDRVITAGNGFDENDARSSVQQFAINEALSHLIVPPTEDNPRYIIDAGRVQKRFEVGHRVMATRNESPDVLDRVTNGMVGVIQEISSNPDWDGNRNLVGPEDKVLEYRSTQINKVLGGHTGQVDSMEMLSKLKAEDFNMGSLQDPGKKDKEGGGPASHRVIVEFMNGAVRQFVSKAEVESLVLAYASTCHKCQGSQFDTAIIVVHHTVKGQLSREWLYTAVTRAQKRVVFLYTTHGIRVALAKQRIFGTTLAQKIEKYRQLQEEGMGPMKARVRLTIEE